MLGRREFTQLSGATLTAPAWKHLDQSAPGPALLPAMDLVGRIGEPVVRLVEETATHAQRLDDQAGGGALGYITDQAHAVARMLRRDSYDAPTGQRLATALARLAQTAGWMAHESLRDAEAQRWFLIALRAAQAADNRSLGASVLALMSNQAAALSQTKESLQLGAAAQEAAADAPAVVQALVTARSGLVYAAAGDLSGFRRSRDDTLALLDQAAADAQPAPPWASYASSTELDAIAGRCLADLAGRIPTVRLQQRLLAQAEKLLLPRAMDDRPESRRSAVRHSTWLALAHARAGDLDQAIETGERALDRLPEITSARITVLLGQLRDDLALRADRPPIRAFIDRMNRQGA
ncbi:hypothetical protein [Streptomyces sp. MP131-18]|uniref:hypothetical protein n=1 Tax=Streptomyces sp. MP131-18 TaxID=1857892 RepID=UPI00117F6F87|nr:hypothetical protein [Streptomyces sp. MP131-18]